LNAGAAAVNVGAFGLKEGAEGLNSVTFEG
jgi:hypothetical protein